MNRLILLICQEFCCASSVFISPAIHICSVFCFIHNVRHFSWNLMIFIKITITVNIIWHITRNRCNIIVYIICKDNAHNLFDVVRINLAFAPKCISVYN